MKEDKQTRLRMDAILALAKSNRAFRSRLIKKPEQTLKSFAFSKNAARHIANKWGVGSGPSDDCGSGTCRLTDPCGWTVCGKTTNSCRKVSKPGDTRVNPVRSKTRRSKVRK